MESKDIRGVETKASVKEHVFSPKHIVLFNTNSLEQFTHMFEIIKYSFNGFKHGVKEHFFKKMKSKK